MADLLPCPFCGSELIDADAWCDAGNYVACSACNAGGPIVDYLPDEDEARAAAIEEWNTRAGAQP